MMETTSERIKRLTHTPIDIVRGGSNRCYHNIEDVVCTHTNQELTVGVAGVCASCPCLAPDEWEALCDPDIMGFLGGTPCGACQQDCDMSRTPDGRLANRCEPQGWNQWEPRNL